MDPNESQVPTIITANITLICVASVIILVRVYVKAFMLKSLGLDDGESVFFLVLRGSLTGGVMLIASIIVLVIISYLLSIILFSLVFQCQFL